MDAPWSLWIYGRLSPKIALSDGQEEALAQLRVRGIEAGALGAATDRDGRTWKVELDESVVKVRCGGVVHARVEGEELKAGGRTFVWSADLDGARRATVGPPDGAPLLDVSPGEGDDGPWAVITVSDDLPSPLAVTLAACFVLLRVEALGRGQASRRGSGSRRGLRRRGRDD